MGPSNVMYDALKAQFEAQKQKALATLTIYLTNPVGIGEHPQHIDEMVTMTRSLAEAIDCIETLEKTFEVKAPKVNENEENENSN
jgi:methylaspartate ammonia-lyase